VIPELLRRAHAVRLLSRHAEDDAKQWDDKVIEADVRGKIAEKVPSKTFAVDVKVNHQVVTLSGHAANESDRRAIGDAAQSVNGVTTVINNITIQ